MLQENPDTAKMYAEEAVTLSREIGDTYRLAVSLHTLADIVQTQDDLSEATHLYQESLIIYQGLGEKRLLAEALEAIGILAAAQEKPERALRLVGAAQALRKSTGSPLPPVQSERIDNVVAPIMRMMGEEAAAQIIAEGRAMSVEEAVMYALAE
jgi:non-specific serine/threonine protein kinase